MKKTLLFISAMLFVGFIFPEKKTIPVAGASAKDWHPKSFWFEPWGSSGVHKGIDIFANINTPLLSTTAGVVVYRGYFPKGGNVVVVLGAKWRLHYFAHMNSLAASWFEPVKSGEVIGSVGDSGNAKGKPAHLHYAILRLIPVPWAIDGSTQGYKKAFFIDPGVYLSD